MLGHVYTLYIPLLITSVLHMVVVKYNLIPVLNVPLATRYFGKNKTYRGLLFLTVVNALFSTILANIAIAEANPYGMPPYAVGALLGFSCIIAELPNSFIKRRLGIPPGESSAKHKWLFTLIDKTDSASAVSMCYVLLYALGAKELIILFLFAFLLHVSVSYLLTAIKVKESF